MPLATREAEATAVQPDRSSLLGTYRAIGVLLKHCLATLVDSLLGRVTDARIDARMRDIGTFVVRASRMRLEVTGTDALDPSQVYLYMSNHESLADIPLVFATAPRPPRMVAKKQLFHVPLFGGAMRAAGIIEIDRQDRRKAIESLRYASRIMAERGLSVWIAPEGTRSRDGSLLPFKKGGFMLALELGVPIVPIGIVGARDVIRPKSFRSYLDQKVAVRYGAPIDPATYGPQGRDALMEDVRAAIVALRAPIAT